MTEAQKHAADLIRIASSIRQDHPVLAHRLDRNVRHLVGDHARVSVVNPGLTTFEEYVEQMVATLKSLAQELETALSDLDDAKEFAKFFTDALAEEEELKELLDKSKKLGKTASGRQAAFGDWFKDVLKYFRSENEEAEEAGLEPSYQIGEKAMDDFVEGSEEWADASYYIEQEFRENQDFWEGSEQVLADMEELRKDPTQEAVEGILDKVKRFIRFGENILSGVRKHVLEPAAKIVLEDDEEPSGGEPSKGPGLKLDLESTVDHYVDVLKRNLGDEAKTVSLLKELFKKVEPAIAEERGELGLAARLAAQRRVLPVLIRLAHSRPHTRPVLLPIIRQATGR